MREQHLLDRTQAAWQAHVNRTMTPEDAREIRENVSGFFAILARWSASLSSRNREGDHEEIES